MNKFDEQFLKTFKVKPEEIENIERKVDRSRAANAARMEAASLEDWTERANDADAKVEALEGQVRLWQMMSLIALFSGAILARVLGWPIQ
jgi:histidinol dehydrogenase